MHDPFAQQDHVYQAQPVKEPEGKRPQTSGKAVASFVLGCLSFLFCVLTALPAFIVGLLGIAEIRHSRGRVTGMGFVAAGMILAIVGSLVPLLLVAPAILVARDASRQNACLTNIRQLGLGVANHESATKRFPLVNNSRVPLEQIVPGSTEPATQDGYSWQVYLLPFMEEIQSYEDIREGSDRFRKPAFDDTILVDDLAHPATWQFAALRCPTGGGDLVDAAHSDLPAGVPDDLTGTPLASGNYVAIVATDGYTPPHARGQGVPREHKEIYTSWENGALVSKCADGPQNCNFRGTTLRYIGDGISRTLIACETKEQAYASWYSGGCSWVVATTGASAPNGPMRVDDHFIGLEPGHGDRLALQFGSFDDGGEKYLPVSTSPDIWGAAQPRSFGPSSNHAGGVVIHVFADIHAVRIRPDIDPDVYLRLVTRSDGDPADISDFDDRQRRR